VGLKQSHHRIRISAAAKSDLIWWVHGIEIFQGTAPFTCDIPLPSFQFSTDACQTGGGGMFQGDWWYVSWLNDLPEFAEQHINVLELECVHIAAERWGHLWGGLHIVVRSDNSATISALNKGTSRSGAMLIIVQHIFWLSIRFGFRLSALFIPGKLNIVSDRISRLHDVSAAIDAEEFLGDKKHPVECVGHMTHTTFSALQEIWMMV
jgi:hypothetical protein